MAGEARWIKLVTNMFENEKIILIETMPDCYAIIVVWIKMLCMAGKQNNGGVFLFANRVPYTVKMLAQIFRMNEATVSMAIKVFQEFGMIEMVDGVITILNWSKYQSLDTYERQKERDRLRRQRQRAEQKALIETKSLPSADTSVDKSVDTSVDVRVVDIEEDIEEDKNKKKKDVGGEQFENCSSPPPDPPIFSLLLNDGSYYGVTQTDIDEYKRLYPIVDIEQEIRKMIGWLNANPAKRKTRRGIKNFINSWLSREQDKGGKSGGRAYGGNQPPPQREYADPKDFY